MSTEGLVGGMAPIVQADFPGLGDVSTRLREDAPRIMQSLSEHATTVSPGKMGDFLDAEKCEKAISDGFGALGTLTKDLMTSEISLAIFAQLASQELGGQDGSSGQTLASRLTHGGVLNCLDGTEDPFSTTSQGRTDSTNPDENSQIIERDGRFGIDWNNDGEPDVNLPQVRHTDGEYYVDLDGDGEWTVFAEPEATTAAPLEGDPMSSAIDRGMVDPWHEEVQETLREAAAEQAREDDPWYSGWVPSFGPIG